MNNLNEPRDFLDEWRSDLTDGYIVYRPTDTMTLEIEHHELWCGLPPYLEFLGAASSGGPMGMRCQQSGVYIWVDPEASEDLGRDQRGLVCALGYRREGSIHFIVTGAKRALEKFQGGLIRHFTSLNRDLLQKSPAYKKMLQQESGR
jgi:hypothetical protein